MCVGIYVLDIGDVFYNILDFFVFALKKNPLHIALTYSFFYHVPYPYPFL